MPHPTHSTPHPAGLFDAAHPHRASGPWTPAPPHPAATPRTSARPHPAYKHLTALLLTLAALLSPRPALAAPPAWRWPLDGHPQVIRRFTPPPAPWLAGHRGIDLSAPPGTPVLAAGPGVIGYAGPVAGRGVVTIHHPNGLRTTYLPVHPSVRQGQQVSTSDHLGTLESTPPPHCPQSCLHWGLLRDTRYLDPLLLTGNGLTRLLPYWPTATPPPAQAPPPPLPELPHLTPPPPLPPLASPPSSPPPLAFSLASPPPLVLALSPAPPLVWPIHQHPSPAAPPRPAL